MRRLLIAIPLLIHGFKECHLPLAKSKMGKCCSKEIGPKKQNKYIDDKRMFKVGVSIMEKDFCIQIGFSRRAIKNYSGAAGNTDALKEDHTERDETEAYKPCCFINQRVYET